MPMTLKLPNEMSISAAAIKLHQKSVNQYCKDLLRDDGLNRDNETAVLLAGLFETHAASTNPSSVAGGADITEPTLRNSPESMDRKWWAGLKAKIHEPVLPHLVY